MTFNEWIDTFVEEKGIDLDQTFEVTGKDWGTNIMPYSVVVEAIKTTNPRERVAIKNMIVAIDFRDGDVTHYFQHLGKALAR